LAEKKERDLKKLREEEEKKIIKRGFFLHFFKIKKSIFP
jgi:hypothetical protein